jgi:hypothetical protein
MHRDDLRYGPETGRGVCSKQFVAELHEQGVELDEAIEAVSRQFGVSRGAAWLFVRSHPAWATEERAPQSLGRTPGTVRSWYLDRPCR